MRRIYQRSPREILVLAASAALVVMLPIETGVTMSIVLSRLHSIYIIARPYCTEFARVPGTTIWWTLGEGEPGEHEPGVLVFALGAPVNFINANYLRGKLMDAVAGKGHPCRLVVIEASGVIDVDFTGSQILQQVVAELRRRNIDVALARLESERAKEAAARTGLIDTLNAEHVFRSVDQAIRGCRVPLAGNTDQPC
jgi:SulP family sulfate permease